MINFDIFDPRDKDLSSNEKVLDAPVSIIFSQEKK